MRTRPKYPQIEQTEKAACRGKDEIRVLYDADDAEKWMGCFAGRKAVLGTKWVAFEQSPMVLTFDWEMNLRGY